jgi:hypothetical protein
MSARIYAVYDGKNGRLVKAKTRAQALSHVAQSTFSVQVASQDELVTLLGIGVKVENYRDPDQPELDLGTVQG